MSGARQGASRGPAGGSSPRGPRASGRSRPRPVAVEAEPPAPPPAAVSTQLPSTPVGAGPSLTTRAAVLLGVLALLAASYSFPLRAWLDQRSDLAAAQAERDLLTGEVGELREQRELWDDPAFVRAQARERLNFVLPGEAGLVVLGTEATDAEPAPPDGAVVPAVSQGEPWWTALVAAFTDATAAHATTP